MNHYTTRRPPNSSNRYPRQTGMPQYRSPSGQIGFAPARDRTTHGGPSTYRPIVGGATRRTSKQGRLIHAQPERRGDAVLPRPTVPPPRPTPHRPSASLPRADYYQIQLC